MLETESHLMMPSQATQLPNGTACFNSRFKPDSSAALTLVVSIQKNPLFSNKQLRLVGTVLVQGFKEVTRTEMTSNKLSDWHYSKVMLINIILMVKGRIYGHLFHLWNVLSFFIIQHILSYTQWRKQRCFDVLIQNVNILCDIGSRNIDCIFTCSQ